MSNQWLRLWHDMPNDPKWRTIARTSSQPISLVQAVYLHLLVDASRNVTRGHTDVTSEDLASALDVTDEAIEAILTAMQGRVLEGRALSGWEKRQPKREDSGDPETGAKSAAQRKREQREREKKQATKGDETPCHDESRNVTLDKDTDKEKENNPPNPPRGKSSPVGIKNFLDRCRTNAEKPIPDNDPVFNYAEEVGIPHEFLRLAWREFVDRHRESDKRYRDWRKAFRNCVRSNWYRLWWATADGSYELTTVGVQAQRKHAEPAA